MITHAEIIKIEDVIFSMELTRRWKHYILTVTNNVTTKIVGLPDAHGQT